MDAPWSSEFLHSIQASLHQDGVAIRNKDGWVIMVSGLSDFWGSFPFLTSASRGTSNERITLTHYGLGILQYLSGEFERVFSGEDELLRKLSVSLLGLCVAAEAEDSKNPSTLYKKASSILYFSQNTEYAAIPSVALGFLSETLDVTSDVLCRAEDEQHPLNLCFFSRPRLARGVPCKEDIPVGGALPLAKSAHFMTVDLTRRVVQLTREIFDLCLSAPMNASTRTRCLNRIVESSRSLCSTFDLEAVVVEDLPARLLARQLVKEVHAQSSPSLRHLASLFSDEAEPFVLTPAHASAIVDVISKDDTFVNTELRVCSILSQPNQAVGNAGSHSSEWRSLASQELRTMIKDGNGVWMDVDDGLSDTLYASRGFEIIAQALNRPLEQVPLTIRNAAVNFITLVSTQPARFPSEAGTSMLVCVLLAKVLIGPSSEVNSLLRRKSYKILSKTIKYGIKELSVDDYHMVTEGLQRGLLDRDRTTRLSAGNAVAELIKAHTNIPEEQVKVHSLFFHFNRILESNIWDGVKETMLITIGLIGRNAGGDVLREVVFSLILQLGEQNPSLKAVAYTQLFKLARHHKKPPPTLLAETCQFLSVRPRDFLSVTLPWTLPFVFANCDNKVLEEISAELEKTPASFFLSHSHDILSFVFRLQGPGETRKALNLHLVWFPSLQNFVMVLGDENEEHAEGVSGSDPAPLLKKHMLGIVCYTNDKLQDVRGKQPIMTKTRIIREAVHSVAPQIMATLQTMFTIPELSEVALSTWFTFLTTIAPQDLGAHVGATSASLLSSWYRLSPASREIAKRTEIADLNDLPELHDTNLELKRRRANPDNHAVALRSLAELKTFMSSTYPDFTRWPSIPEMHQHDSRMVVRSNFTDEAESVLFAMHLIKDVLVGAFRSTSDIKYQANLAYTIQELLRFCNFTPALVTSRNTTSVPVKVRNRWNNLPKHVLETITPLLEGRFSAPSRMPVVTQHPIYPEQNTYREWLQLWTTHLITRASGDTARRIFGVFRTAIRYKDVEVAHHLLPHIKDAEDIRTELLVVLEDQVDSGSSSSADKKVLSAQVVFMLLDHLSKYVRILRQDISSKKAESSKRSRTHHALAESEEQLVRVDSLLSSINHDLMAKAALQCKAYARSLMNFERQIVNLQEQGRPTSQRDLTPYYERLHEIYSYIDEPDGMEGISTLILSPSLEHQIRQHESTGRWTAAQSCWEVRLQQSPDNLEFHIGLLHCLRNLGHYDTLRTHVRGVLVRNPSWESALASFQAESAWMIGAWDDLRRITETNEQISPSVMKARVLLAMHSGEHSQIATALSRARSVLGSPISASGTKGYRRSYDAVLDLHTIHELEMIYRTVSRNSTEAKALRTTLNAQSVLSMRRVAFSLSKEIGRTWLASAKIARTARQWQTAYSATLQAQQGGAPFYFMESAKLLKAYWGAELENSMRLSGMDLDQQDTIDLTEEDNEEFKCLRAKAHILLARWMNESGRYDTGHLLKAFSTAANQGAKLESAHYHLGHFHDQWFKQLPSSDDERGIRMNLHTVKEYSKAMMHGSKYVYQAIPRILTLWISTHAFYAKINGCVASAIDSIPVYKWFTAFPQIVSRVGHSNPKVYGILSKLICKVIREYPHQALWLFASVVKSTKANRETRGRTILEALQVCYVTTPIDDDRKTLSMRRDFPKLAALGRSPLLIPLQESLTSSTENSVHVPFPTSAPTFEEFSDEIEVMRSLARPRKITIRGSNGQTYMFLGKPKDDLRKDARLMDFNAIINKLLKANSESRKRQLHIRTYGVVTLNEECGFIQWVPNTIPIRPVLLKYYEARRIRCWSTELSDIFRKIKDAQDKDAAELFVTKVLPVRLSYGRTAAVMSMVGFILGLGDRHCENILLDTNTGDVVHVDFNCLFEKGKTLETPERVPFRLTQNMTDGLGVTGVEGVFRIACEITMQLLKNNKDSLMSVLDAFIHDPLVEWEDEKRKMDRERRNVVKSSTDLRHLAKNALRPIERKLRGVYSPWNVKSRMPGGTGDEREISTGNLVQMLIQEAAKMYPGWAAWH
ncbi:hypothetical protein BKA83DRAFT_672562 [Pisolithus microcarpus]|nr:hypothetical protein BKA83DRAFT_672562 [Pisolithus microcarpus]